MPESPADFLIENAALIATCAGPAPRRGHQQRDAGVLEHATVASSGGRIVYVGPARGFRGSVDDAATRIDARGLTVVPGFVDAHTHVVYAGDRRDELRRRLAGATYAEIAAEGGGILRTVTATRGASEETLVASALPRLNEMAACGTTTCEVKSGYGLTLESELRQLRAIRQLGAAQPVDIVATFLGAHAIPREFIDRPDEYVTVVKNEMLPAVAREGLAEWCDVFCEHGAFNPSQSAAILRAGTRAGLKPRMHADELAASGGAQVAAGVMARSADHLIFVDEAGIEALARAGVCAVLLPSAAMYLKLGRFAPARDLIDRGVAVALGSDVNPGGGLSPSLPFVMALACFAMAMTLEESLIAATLNAAWSLDRADRVGSLEVGKQMDAVIVDGDLTDLIRAGASPIRTVIKRGKVIFER